MAEPQDETLEVKTKWGAVIAHGTSVFIVVAIAALTAATFWEHSLRSKEHDELSAEHIQLSCLIRLNIFMHTLERETKITWQDIPTEYWPCLPQSMVNKQTTR